MSRPEILFPLFAALDTLTGVGPKTAQHFEALGVAAPRDLLFTLPQSGVDRALRDTVQGAAYPTTITVKVQVGPHMPARSRGGAYRIHVEDAQTSFQLVFFHGRSDYLQKVLPTGSERIVSGKVEQFEGIANMVHPEHILPVEEAKDIPPYEPVYPLTSGVTQKTMWKATRSALARVPDMAEWIDPAQIAQAGWPAFADAV
ncbi:MAG: ATP-dependent DNA helicase RecG, partial [Pseudomonadota bacterium]